MGSSKLCRVHVELLLFTVWNEVRHKHGTELDNSQRELSSEHIISYTCTVAPPLFVSSSSVLTLDLFSVPIR